MLSNEKAQPKRSSLKHGQIVELADVLRAHANVENGHVTFHDGWNVARVIEETARRGFTCNEKNIDNVCRQVLRAPLQPDRETLSTAMKRIRDLEFELSRTRGDLMTVMDFLTRRHGAGWKLKGEVTK